MLNVADKPAPEVDLASMLRVLETLACREREIIKLRYGLGCDRYTLAETARIFKVTGERVRQIEAEAISKLRHPVRLKMLIGK